MRMTQSVIDAKLRDLGLETGLTTYTEEIAYIWSETEYDMRGRLPGSVVTMNAVFPIEEEGGRTAIRQLPSGGCYYPQARRENGLLVNVVALLHFTISQCRGRPYMPRLVGILVTVTRSASVCYVHAIPVC